MDYSLACGREGGGQLQALTEAVCIYSPASIPTKASPGQWIRPGGGDVKIRSRVVVILRSRSSRRRWRRAAGSDGPPLYPVHGKVMYKGQPAVGATVMFRGQGPEPQHDPAGADRAGRPGGGFLARRRRTQSGPRPGNMPSSSSGGRQAESDGPAQPTPKKGRSKGRTRVPTAHPTASTGGTWMPRNPRSTSRSSPARTTWNPSTSRSDRPDSTRSDPIRRRRPVAASRA